MKKIALAVMLACVFFAAPAMAKQGLYLGGFFQLTDISGESISAFSEEYFDSLDPGLGFGGRLGYGFNNYLAIEGSLFASFHTTDFLGIADLESQLLTGETIDIKLTIPLQGSTVEPYIFIGIGAYQIGDTGGTYFSGTGSQFGAGIDIYSTPELSINIGLTWRSIEFDNADFPFTFEADADVVSIDVGIAYHFF